MTNGTSGDDVMIVKIIRELFSQGRLYYFSCLFGIVLMSILLLPCPGLGIGSSEPVFSVTSNNEPLYKVLSKISGATGYQITITKSWENKPITADIQNSTLEEGIRKIIRSLGEPSNAIVRNDRVKKIEIRIFDTSSGYSSGKMALPPETEREKNIVERPSMEREAQKPQFETDENMPQERKRGKKKRHHD